MENGESVIVYVNQDIKKWEFIIGVDFISKTENRIVLEGQFQSNT